MLPVEKLGGVAIALITAHEPRWLMWASLAQDPTLSNPKQWKFNVHIKN